MHWIDLALIGVLAFCALLGLTRGFVNEALGMLSLAIATFIALSVVEALFPVVEHTTYVHAYGLEKPAAQNWIKVAIYIAAVSFSAAVPFVLSRTFGDVLVTSTSGPAGRLAGAAVGCVKGIGYIVAAYLLAEMIIPPASWPPQWSASRGLPFIYEVMRTVSPLLPETMRPDILPPFGRGSSRPADL